MTTTTSHAQHDGTPGAEKDGAGQASSFWSATWLVADRELRTFLRMKSFWIGFGFVVVGLFAAALLPTLFGGDRPSVAVVGSAASTAVSGTTFETTNAADVAAAEHLVRTEEVDAAVVPDPTGQSATGVRVLALAKPPAEIVAALGTTPPVDLLKAPAVGQGERILVVMVFGLLFFMFGMGGMAIAQSTVIEKQTRIVEILVATIPVRALLAGKIVGHSLLTIGQVAALAVIAPVPLWLGGHTDLLAVVAPAVGWFVPFMCLGFVLLAAMWAVTGSLVSRQEDLGSSMSLVTFLVVIPYLAVIFFSENTVVLTVLSYLPFSSPVAMPVRMFIGEAAVWEALAALALLVVAVVVVIALASRLYSGSLLQTRGKVALSRAWARAD